MKTFKSIERAFGYVNKNYTDQGDREVRRAEIMRNYSENGVISFTI